MFSLGNVHPKFRSSLKAMYLDAVAIVPNIEKYGIDKILRPFVRDVHRLTETGISINVDGKMTVFKTIHNFVKEEFELRTPVKHAQQCDSLQLADGIANSTKYGINRRSILENVMHFSVASRALAHDFMHDV